MQRSRRPLALALVAVALAVAPTPWSLLAAQEIDVLFGRYVPLGSYDPEQLAGEWTALCPPTRAGDDGPGHGRHPAGPQFELSAVQLWLEVYDDPETHEMYGGPVAAPRADCPSGRMAPFFFRGLPGPLPRAAATAELEASQDGRLYLGERLFVHLGDETWSVLLTGCADEGPWLRDPRLHLQQLTNGDGRSGLRQTIDLGDDGSPVREPRIAWAGDLDDDGRLDLWLENGDGDGAMRYRWYLSSVGGNGYGDGELMSEVADLVAGPGC